MLNIPLAAPLRDRGAPPSTALLFGAWNNAKPSPQVPMRHAISDTEADAVRRERNAIPALNTSIPSVAMDPAV